MNAKAILIVLFSFFLPCAIAYSATPEQCYVYFTELVRSSSFSFKKWSVKPQEVNLLIDEDEQSIIRAKLFVDTDGTGTLGWVSYNKNKKQLLDTTIDPDKPVKLSFNSEYAKAQKYCLQGEVVYQVKSNGRTYFYRKENNKFEMSDLFIVKGDCVHLVKNTDGYSNVNYEDKNGRVVTGWIVESALKKIDFLKMW